MYDVPERLIEQAFLCVPLPRRVAALCSFFLVRKKVFFCAGALCCNLAESLYLLRRIKSVSASFCRRDKTKLIQSGRSDGICETQMQYYFKICDEIAEEMPARGKAAHANPRGAVILRAVAQRPHACRTTPFLCNYHVDCKVR